MTYFFTVSPLWNDLFTPVERYKRNENQIYFSGKNETVILKGCLIAVAVSV